MIVTSDHGRRIYGAEAKALVTVETRLLDRTTASELAQRALGQQAIITTMPDHGIEAGFIGCAEWVNGKPFIAVADCNNVSDLLLAHEIGHLVADRHGKLGHGSAWLMGYLSVLRSWHRHDAALALRTHVGPVALGQPASDLLAASA